MPEGDTIHQIAAAIRPRLEGERIVRARVGHRPRHRVAESLEGRKLEGVYATGKNLFMALSGDLLLRSHLGMYGSWHRYRIDETWRKPERQLSLALWTRCDVVVCFNAREIESLPAAGIRKKVLDRRLGPDLLEVPLDANGLVARAREFLEAPTPLVDVLLDQRAASGIGNVYKSEVLFIERMHPLASLAETSDDDLGRLYRRASGLLARNLGGGRRRTRFSADGGARLWVYARRDKPCLRCGRGICYQKLGRDLRGTYWCPSCQSRSTCGEPEGTRSAISRDNDKRKQ